MLNTDGQYRLVFSTQTEQGINGLIQELQLSGFISQNLFEPNNCNEYCVGDEFLSALTFMGCSPYIELEPPKSLKPEDKAEFCFIRLSKTIESIVGYHSGQFNRLTTIPRCKLCRKIINDWPEQAIKLNNTEPLNCTTCNKSLALTELDWRKASGIGNVFIEILNVYLQEAVPTDAFLKQLEALTSSEWQYFYTDSNLKTMLLDRT